MQHHPIHHHWLPSFGLKHQPGSLPQLVFFRVYSRNPQGKATLDAISAPYECQLPIPGVFITADDVVNGKPSPEGYLLAAQRLGKNPHTCVVIEDSPAGLQAANTAGMKAIAVATTHTVSELTAADLIVPELKQLVLAINEQYLEFTAPDMNY